MEAAAQPRSRSRIARTFSRVIGLKSGSNPGSGFCLLIPQDKLRCCESQHKEDAEDAKEECRNRAALEAMVAKLFATISSAKAAYAELQMAQFPYNADAIQCADQAVVEQLRALSDLKYAFLKNQMDSSPPHVTLMLAEIQEQQSLMKTYEITMKKMRADLDAKDARIESLRQHLRHSLHTNQSLEAKINASGTFSILDSVRFSHLTPNDFILVLHYSLRSLRAFVRFLIRQMESANWDIHAAAAAAAAIHHDAVFTHRDHKAFAFESFVCREIFSGFGAADESDTRQRRLLFFDQFRVLRSASAVHFAKQSPNSLFGKFLKSKYLRLVHPKMELSFCGHLNQRKMVNSGEFPETEFFKAFAEMGRRVWLLHCLALSFDREVSVFQVSRNSKYSEVYMESVTDGGGGGGGGARVAFTVVPGFKVGQTVVQSQVYVFPPKS